MLRYIQGHRTCIGAYPEGHYVECDSSARVCASEENEVTYYGSILDQLDLVIEQMNLPRHMHINCPTSSEDTIAAPQCNWMIAFGREYCDVIFHLNLQYLLYQNISTNLLSFDFQKMIVS